MRKGRIRRATWLTAAVVVAACVVVAARADLWQPFEPDLVETAREMRERGDWLHPRLNGMPYLEKPPLYYWAVLGVSWFAGALTEFTARVPSIVAGIVALVAVNRFAKGLFGRQTAWSATALLATMPVFFDCTFRGMTDGLLGAALVVSALLFWRDVWGEEPSGARPPSANALGAWASLALAFLAKGPVAAVVVALLFLPEMVFSRRLGPWLRAWRRQAPGIACFLLIVAPWYVLGVIEDGRLFLDMALFSQNTGRFFGPSDGSGPLFLFEQLPSQIGVWTLMLPGVAWLAWNSARWRRDGTFDPVRFLVAGSLLVLVFLSASPAKLPKYVLVVVPYVAILSAQAVSRLSRGAPPTALWGLGLGLWAIAALLVVAGVAVALAPLVAPDIADRVPGLDAAWLWPYAIVLAAGGAAGLRFAARREWRACVPSAALAVAVAALAVAATPTLARIDESMTTRPFAERAARRIDDKTPLLGFGMSDCESLFLYYSHRTYRPIGLPGRLVARVRRDGRVLVLTSQPFLDLLRADASARFRVLEQQEAGKRGYLLVEGTAVR